MIWGSKDEPYYREVELERQNSSQLMLCVHKKDGEIASHLLYQWDIS